MRNFLLSVFQSVSERPWDWSLAFLVPALLIIWAAREFPRRWPLGWLAGIAGFTAIAAFAWYQYRALVYPGYLDGMDPLVSDVSWYFAQGKPVYHAEHAGEIYNILYGPAPFILTGWTQKLLGPSVFSAKLPGQLALLAGFIFTFVAAWRRVTLGWALLATAMLPAGILALSGHIEIARVDCFLIGFVALGGWAMQWRSSWHWLPPLIGGAALGIVFDLKAHGPLYLFPLVPLAWQQWRSYRFYALGILTCIVFAVAPFIVFRNISLWNYLHALQRAGGHGFDPNLYLGMWESALGLITPIGIWIGLAFRSDAAAAKAAAGKCRPMLVCLGIAFVILLIPASKYGAGPHHLLALLPTLIIVAVELWAAGLRVQGDASAVFLTGRAVLLSWFVAAIGGATLRSHQLASWIQGRDTETAALVDEAKNIAAQHQADSIILMGAGDNTRPELPYLRSIFVFAGNPIGIDTVSLNEFVFSGEHPANVAELTTTLTREYPGKKILIAVPRGEPPFRELAYFALAAGPTYLEHPVLFDDAFRADFQADFAPLEHTAHFDLYALRPAFAVEHTVK